MEFKNYLIELLSTIVEEKLTLLNETKANIEKVEEFKKVEELFTDINNIVNIDNEELKLILSQVTDDDTIDGIISNIEMIKIVEKGISSGLDLTLDESQIALIDGVYTLVNAYRVELENKNLTIKKELEEFITKCEQICNEVSTGVVKDMNTLNEIFNVGQVSLEDSIKAKFQILKNNNKNYNMNLDDKVKEELDIRLFLKNINFDFDSFANIEKQIIINNCEIDKCKLIMDFIINNNINLNKKNLLILLLLSDVNILSSIVGLSIKYQFEFNDLFKIPGVFVYKEKDDFISQLVNEYKDNEEYENIKFLEFVNGYYEIFVNNINLLEKFGKNVYECYKNNILSLIIPDMEKNLTILEEINLDSNIFSVVVINPYLATSKSSFEECGLGEYLKNNPLRLCTSYFRIKNISQNIIKARKNGDIIFRSLSDKKNYWLAKNITHNNDELGV